MISGIKSLREAPLRGPTFEFNGKPHCQGTLDSVLPGIKRLLTFDINVKFQRPETLESVSD